VANSCALLSVSAASAFRKIFRPSCISPGTVGVDFEILKAADRVNKQRIGRFLEKVHQALWVVKGKRVAILGLAFKANTDDVRFSPALEVARRIVAEGATFTPRTLKPSLELQPSCRKSPITTIPMRRCATRRQP
jgi:UDP-N-acetyl-D-mannosaminuronate dehydrogenase